MIGELRVMTGIGASAAAGASTHLAAEREGDEGEEHDDAGGGADGEQVLQTAARLRLPLRRPLAGRPEVAGRRTHSCWWSAQCQAACAT